ncbi:MAG: hypothetical protein IPN29_00535 [Saprospiraceae bacterium]|nr:hypothetical protein [Saprospiraceae bacterium]
MKGISSYGNINDIQLIGIYPGSSIWLSGVIVEGNLSVKVDSGSFSL